MIKWGKFSNKANDFIKNSNTWLNILHGSVRSSKTVNCTVRWIFYALNDAPDGTLAMIGKTRTTLQRNVLDDLIDTVGKRNFRWLNKPDGLFSLFGRKVYAIGANDERSEEKIRGATFAGAYCDEVSLYPKSFWDMLLTRLSVPDAKCFANTNPDSPYHWFYKNVIQNDKLANKKIWHFTMDDNANLSEDYKAKIKTAFSGLFYKRFIDGLWIIAEGAIYDMFDDKKHVLKNVKAFPAEYDAQCVSVDYGTTNPTAFLRIGRKDEKYYVDSEYYYSSAENSRQKTDGEYADDLVYFLNGDQIPVIVDPSAASFIVELERRGVDVRHANNSVLDGIRTVSTLLSKDCLYINGGIGGCHNLIKEMQSYSWDAKAQKAGIDAPLKVNDHAVDSLRYGVMFLSSNNSDGEITNVTHTPKLDHYGESIRIEQVSGW